MHWNHRVIKETFPQSSEIVYSIREVYYKDGSPWLWSLEPKPAKGIVDKFNKSNGLEDLKISLKRMLDATEKPVLIVVKDKKGKESLKEE